MMFALSDLDLTVGFGGDGLQIDGGTLGLAVIKAPTPAAGTDNRSWVALSGHDLDFTLVLPGITADVDDVTLKINRASGQRTPPPTGNPPTPGVPVLATALNWATADATPLPAAVDLNQAGGWTTPSGLVDPGSILPTPVPLGITYRGEPLAIAGKLTGISMFDGFVTGSADFEIESGIVAVDLPGTAPDPASPSLLRLGLSNAALTIGDPAGVNVLFSNASLALASLKAGTPATGSDTRQWLALKGTIGLATINGLPTELDLEVKSLTVEINRASGLHKTAANVETQAVALNWLTQLNLDKDATAGEATDDRLVIAGVPIDFTGDFLRASGRLDIDLFGFVQGSVAFAFQQQAVDVKIGSGAVFSGNLTTIALNILGDDGNAANGVENGLFIGTPDRSIGFSVASGSLAIAALKPDRRRRALVDRDHRADRQRHLLRRRAARGDGQQPARRDQQGRRRRRAAAELDELRRHRRRPRELHARHRRDLGGDRRRGDRPPGHLHGREAPRSGLADDRHPRLRQRHGRLLLRDQDRRRPHRQRRRAQRRDAVADLVHGDQPLRRRPNGPGFSISSGKLSLALLKPNATPTTAAPGWP